MSNQHILILDDAQQAPTLKHIILPRPKIEPLHEVFEEAMLEDNSVHQHRNPFDWVASMGVHFAILAMLLILPLYFTDGLDVHKLNLTFLATPPVAAPPPAPFVATAMPRMVHRATVQTYVPGKLTAPSFIPRVIAPATPGDVGVPDVPAIYDGVPGGIPGGVPGGVIGGVIGGIVKSVPAPPPPVPVIVAAAPKKPIVIGGDVKPPRLIFSVAPEYPPLAKESKIFGVVVIEAIIDEHGNVTGMKAISGHPLLISAALKAVAKRKYEPTILDGEPTPIDLKVEVTFNLT